MANFVGDTSPEIFNGTDEDDVAYGNGGSDTLNGNGGRDWLEGGAASDRLTGGLGNDVLVSSEVDAGFREQMRERLSYDSLYYDGRSLDNGLGRDVLIGGAGDDVIAAGWGDIIDGGTEPGESLYDYDILYLNVENAPTGVVLDFRQQGNGLSMDFHGGSITGIETVGSVSGSAFDDEIVTITTDWGFGSTVYGNGGNDRIIATGRATRLSGGDGDDWIDAQNYAYHVLGDAGDDVIQGGSYVSGGAGDDLIIFSGQRAQGGDGDDIIRFVTGYEYEGSLEGGAGDDLLIGGDNRSTIYGGEGADRIYGNGGKDYLSSADGFDAGPEQDRLFGGDGDDEISIGRNDIADGGAGFDILNISYRGATSGITLNPGIFIGATVALAGTGSVANFEAIGRIAGSDFDDHIIMPTQTASSLYPQAYGGAGDDVIEAGGTRLTAYGEDGDDWFIAGPGQDSFDGGAGVDTIDFIRSTAGVTADVGTGRGRGGGDTFYGVENISGSAFDDRLTGNVKANVLSGGGGADILIGLGGNDVLDGGAGVDVMRGGVGNDVYYVDNVADRVVEDSREGLNDTVYASVSYSVMRAHVETLILTGTAAIDATGNNFANVLTGNAGANVLNGMGGADVLTGGGGADLFAFTIKPVGNNVDTITDFAVGEDRIGLDALIFRAGPRGTLRDFNFHVGATAADAQDRILYDSATGRLLYDADGSGAGAAVQFAQVGAGLALTAGDFVLM
jgi:serralysin